MIEAKQIANNLFIIRLCFDIDIENIKNLNNLRIYIDNLLKKEKNKLIIVLDFDKCLLIDSLGIGTIIRIFEKTRRKKANLFIINANHNIKKVLNITSINSLVPLISNLEEIKNVGDINA